MPTFAVVVVAGKAIYACPAAATATRITVTALAVMLSGGAAKPDRRIEDRLATDDVNLDWFPSFDVSDAGRFAPPSAN